MIAALKIGEISKLKYLTQLKNLKFFQAGEDGSPAAETIESLLTTLAEASGDAGYERLLSLYNFMRKQAGSKTAWKTLQEMKDLPGMPFGISGEPWRKMAEEVNKEMFSKCARGQIPLKDMPSYTAWKNEFKGLKLGSNPKVDKSTTVLRNDIHIHHAVETRFQGPDFLGITGNPNDVPGYVIRGGDHKFDEDALVNALSEALNPLKGTGDTYEGKLAIATRIRDVYLSDDPPLSDLWAVT